MTVSGGQKAHLHCPRPAQGDAHPHPDDSRNPGGGYQQLRSIIILDNLKNSWQVRPPARLLSPWASLRSGWISIIFLNEGRWKPSAPRSAVCFLHWSTAGWSIWQRLRMVSKGGETHDASELVLWALSSARITALLVAAYAAGQGQKTAMGFERNKGDGRIAVLPATGYARPQIPHGWAC